VDGDGDYDSDDRDVIVALAGGFGSGTLIGTSGGGGYNVDADLDQDGDVDSTDLNLAGTAYTAALAPGEISSDEVDNPYGYSGAVFAPEVDLYLLRNRWYSTTLGRWLERDPAGYVDGMNLYLYVGANPLLLIDPLGLLAAPPLRTNLAPGEEPGFWYYVTAIASQFCEGAGEGARRWKDGVEGGIKDVVILGGNTIGIVPDEDLLESPLAESVYNNALNTDSASVVEDLVDVTVDSVDQTAGDIASGDPDRMSRGFINVSLATSPGALGKRPRVRGPSPAGGGKGLARAADDVADGGLQEANRVPNPHGKRGGPAHQGKIKEVAADIKARGLKPQTEARVRTPNGQKQYRDVDVVARDRSGNIVEMHQVGRGFKRNPRIPMARERAALRDLRYTKEGHRAQRFFHPYNNIPFSGL